MIRIFSILFATCFVLMSSRTSAQVFLYIDGIKGESTTKGHEKEIQLESYSWGATNSSTFGTTGATVGKTNLGDFTVSKQRGVSSAQLQTNLFSGKIIPKMEIRLYKSGVDPSQAAARYLTVTLENVFVTSFQLSGSGTERPVESFSFKYVRIKTEDVKVNADGTVERTTSGWDVSRNAAY